MKSLLSFIVLLILCVSWRSHAAANAKLVPEGQYRQTVALVYNRPGQISGEIFCSATLIGPQSVLTAAHCIYKAAEHFGLDVESLVDGLWISVGDSPEASLIPIVVPNHKVEKVSLYPHSELNTNSPSLSDFSVLTLKNAVDPETAGFIPLPLKSIDYSMPAGKRITSVGYGRIHDDSNKGLKTYFTLSTLAGVPSGWIRVGTQSKAGPSACGGDSGGSAYLASATGEATALVGVTSGISATGCGKAVTIYITITKNIYRWILSTGAILFSQAKKRSCSNFSRRETIERVLVRHTGCSQNLWRGPMKRNFSVLMFLVASILGSLAGAPKSGYGSHSSGISSIRTGYS